MSDTYITSHKVNGLNESIEVVARDEPDGSGACHKYEIVPAGCGAQVVFIDFQKGPLLEAGVNGVSIESLLAVAEHRLLGFQSGPFACRENAVALTKLQECMMWLHKRTRDRIARGVEGTNQK